MVPDSEQSLASLTTESINPASADLSDMSALDIVRTMNGEDALVAAAVGTEAERIADAVAGIAERLRRGGRLVYVGTGTSGRLGVLDAAECPPTFDTPPELVVGLIAGGAPALMRSSELAEDSSSTGRADLERLKIGEADSVVGISASGRTPYVLGAIALAAERGALTIGLACNVQTELEEAVDIMIHPVVGPEVLAGSTRLKAGTAQKMVLNMLSTGVMVLLGKTFGNLMVDMRATNMKLRDRSVRILRTVTGLGDRAARDLLMRCDGELKVAIVAGLADTDAASARERLARSGGIMRAVVEENRFPVGDLP
jgi:N-acetylmuramic acid 6-phosphate etherase